MSPEEYMRGIASGELPRFDKGGAEIRETISYPAGGIAATLAERGARYGDFTGHAAISQALKRVMRDTPNWHVLSSAQAEALEMIAHKLGRILNGDPDYADSWHDIAGYAKLAEDRCPSQD